MENAESNPPPSDKPPADNAAYTEKFQHQPVSARVPERVAKGVTSTGVVVLDTPNEFVLDFLQGLVRPFAVVARVIMVPPMLQKLLTVTGENLKKYSDAFGAPITLPKPPTRRPTIQEIYENFKLPDEMLSGFYANNVRMGHSPAEFFIDFITDFYPTAAVSTRIFLAPPHVPRLLDTLKVALEQYERRRNTPGNSE